MLELAYILRGVEPNSNSATTRPLAAACAPWGKSIGFTDTVSDSREVVDNALFIALAGARTDGHTFLPDVAARGARGALVTYNRALEQRERLAASRRPWVLIDTASPTPRPLLWSSDTGSASGPPPSDLLVLIAVDDPLAALQRLAAYHRGNLTPTVVAITGSVGKTSTKEVVAALLSRQYRTLKSKRSYNSEVTLPTTLMHITPSHQMAVVEIGMWAPGEIPPRPHLGIITNVGTSHLERMGSIDAIAAAKAELLDALPPDGVAILNADDPRVNAMASQCRARVVRYGLSPDADIRADQVVSHGLNGISFRVHAGTDVVPLSVPLPGTHQVSNVLAAIAVAREAGIAWPAIAEALRDPTMNVRIVVVAGHTRAGACTIIDDSYNASPASTRAALNLLAASGTPPQRVAILGDMLELGDIEAASHHAIGQQAASIADRLICVGPRARWIAEAERNHGLAAHQVQSVQTTDEVLPALQAIARPDDYILVKGSRAMTMERIVAALRSAPAPTESQGETRREDM